MSHDSRVVTVAMRCFLTDTCKVTLVTYHVTTSSLFLTLSALPSAYSGPMASAIKLLEREDEYRKTWNVNDFESLLPGERFWTDHYLWLESQGYKLRPRYHPNWIPAWKKSKKSMFNCEDSIALPPTVRDLNASKDLVDLTLS